MENTHKLIMYNDSIHSFQYVMACLIKFCEQNPLQAEQCALIAHTNGQCSIKCGDFNTIMETHFLFDRVGVKTEILQHEGSVY